VLDKRQLAAFLAPALEHAALTYVWDVEGSLPSTGKVAVTIGDLEIRLDLRFLHERRYALGILFGFRNPQADIDRLLFRAVVRPGDVILDAGANIGLTAAEALACGAAHVVCVEPEDALASRLISLKSHTLDRLSVWHCALAAYEGTAELLLSQTHNQGHTISSTIAALFPNVFDGRCQTVPTTTIDIVSSSRPSAIWKLDVEGMEADVIKGARQTLKRSPPRVILAELYDPFVEDVVGLLPSYNVRRATITKKDYSLKLVSQIGGPLADEFCSTSPTYIFARRE
jgi:FkbM family methyltransferase